MSALKQELLAALKEALAVVEEELATIIDSHTMPFGDLATLDEVARPHVGRYQAIITKGRALIARAEKVQS